MNYQSMYWLILKIDYVNYCLVVSFIILFIVLSCKLLSVRVFYYTVHCIVLWTTVLSVLLLYCSLYCPVNYCLVLSFIILLIVLSYELLSFRVFYYTVHCMCMFCRSLFVFRGVRVTRSLVLCKYAGVTSGAGTAYPSEASEFTPGF